MIKECVVFIMFVASKKTKEKFGVSRTHMGGAATHFAIREYNSSK
jgi:hypothetical protein